MSHDLNSLKGDYIRGNIGDYYRVIKGDTRSLDSSSYNGYILIIKELYRSCIGFILGF